MSKYSFIQMGEKVKYDPFGDGNYRIMQVCTHVPKVIKDDTSISLIPIEEEHYEEEIISEIARADELKPYLKEFNKGYWCAIQDACANGASDTTIKDMIKAAGFTYYDCLWLMEDSDFQNEHLNEIIETIFQKTFERLVEELDFEPEFLMLELSNGDTVRGIVIEERIDRKNDTGGKYIYDIRHADATEELATIEQIVRVNRECSIALDSPIEEVDYGGYLEIEDWSYEDWEEAAYNVLSEQFEDAPSHKIQEFISDYWENMESFERNIETFKQFMGNDL